jgi:UDP-GlcNAc3NAcA epimerase
MKKIVTIIGARPQIIKAAAISRAICTHFSTQIEEIIVHTGQHYDPEMSEVFFNELQIPKPNFNLKVGSGNHGAQTAKMIEGIEQILLSEKPDYIILYGDTNSTLAGSIAASKLHVPIVHIEAGLRSFNKQMPEEINRILTDHCSTILCSPTQAGLDNLEKEGFSLSNQAPFTSDNPGVFNVGDVMFDNSLFFSELAEKQTILQLIDIENKPFILTTLHRNANTDDPKRLTDIISSLVALSETNEIPFVLPIHPRTQKQMDLLLPDVLKQSLTQSKYLKIVPPVSFLDMVLLEKNASLIITDSGGVQKEAYFFQKPCLILRPETEWVEIVASGAALLCDANAEKIKAGFQYFYFQKPVIQFLPLYGNGDAAQKILNLILKNHGN